MSYIYITIKYGLVLERYFYESFLKAFAKFPDVPTEETECKQGSIK